jgi:agmatine/peptidylarginine deiminase
MKRFYIRLFQKTAIGIAFLLSINSFAQDLPKSLTTQEKLLMKDYYSNNNSRGYFYPPSSKVRSVAEWEEIDALIVTWTSYTSVLREIVRAAVNECKVYVVCSDSNAVKSYLSSGSVNLTNVRYVLAPFNSVWVRDYAANNVYTNEVDSLLLVDWTYNRPRPKDDTLARSIAKFSGLPLYEMTQLPDKLVATGGNFMSDGLGTAFSSKLILNENATGGGYNQNLSEAQIDTMAKKYLGIQRYIMFETLPYDGIHHIDMHSKLLNEETILFGQYPAATADGPQIEANLQYLLATHLSAFGTPYKVIRMPMPPDPANSNQYPPNGDYLTYTNGVFVNKTFIYPTYYAQYDSIAQRIYEKALPGYHVVGINCNSTIPSSGAIHCITHCIASNDPLLIVHQPVKDTLNLLSQPLVEIIAYIKHRSGIQHARLFYKVNSNASFDSINMLPIIGQPNYYKAVIQLPISKAVLAFNYSYYISAKANSGKLQQRPITAPNGYWNFVYNMELGIHENNLASTLRLGAIYPNPASAITCIPVETSKDVSAKIELFEMQGRKIKTIYEGKIPSGNKNFFINAAELSKGVYFVKLSGNENSFTQKLLVK